MRRGWAARNPIESFLLHRVSRGEEIHDSVGVLDISTKQDVAQ